jgi:hydroxylaminobenzene mutase
VNKDYQVEQSRKLIQFGVLLFLLGLVTGFVIPALKNPRMGLSSHMAGVLNGMLLMIFGLIWPKLELTKNLLNWNYWLSLFGTFTNWFTTLLASAWGAGSVMMPIAGNEMHGTDLQEIIIKFGLVTLSISMMIVSIFILWGMRKKILV